MAPRLGDGGEVFELAVLHELVEAADGILVEVRRGAVVVQGGLVLILLVDEDGGGVALDEVGDIVDAAGLAAGGRGERDRASR